MSWSYWCPHCRGGLNPAATVILVAEHGSVRALIGLHPQPGVYQAAFPPDVEAAPGSRWSFSCPLCRENLSTGEAPLLCALDGLLEGRRHRIYFSPVAGEEATFVVSAEGVESFGRDAAVHPLDLLEYI